MKQKDHKFFNYVIIAAVLIIPFMYSFFYLKAYWNPYGEGNIDNLPVAIVNEDKGSKGEELVKEIKDSKKLKLSVVDSTKAEDGLYNKDYYAVINIPEDFTESMESASTTNKKHATITYSPNQKSNYLASQIINNVVNVVEKNLDNKVNSEIVGTLSDTVKEVPDKLENISDGFDKLNDGTNQLKEGSNTLTSGTESLKQNYTKFNEGVKSLQSGTNTLASGAKEFNQLTSGLSTMQTGVTNLKNGSDAFTTGLNSYVTGVNSALANTNNLASIVVSTTCARIEAGDSTITEYDKNACLIAKGMLANNANYGGTNAINYLTISGNKLNSSNQEINAGINTLNSSVSSLGTVNEKITKLQNGANSLLEGANTLYSSSEQIMNGINTLNDGANTLNSGITTLNNSVSSAKNELNENIETTKKEVAKVNGLKEYSNEPVKVDTEAVNEVSSYGTAFSPFFISIALWVGCLMLYIVLYFDKEERFKRLSINNPNLLQRTLCYHGLATLAGIILGILLQILLDFEITNVLLYYVSIVLIANTFVAIIELLIVNFKDIGKFIALILLVLQLAAAGGTFPIETVTKGFRWLHPILPMTYTIDLLRESLVTIESKLLTHNFIIVFIIFIVFFGINIAHDIIRQKKNE